jgi:hypothetical protein
MVKVLLYRTMENMGNDYYMYRGFEALGVELQAVCVDRFRASYLVGRNLPLGGAYNRYVLRKAGKDQIRRMGPFDLLLVLDYIDFPFDMTGLAKKTAYWAYDPMRSEERYGRLGDNFDNVFVTLQSWVPTIRKLFPSAKVEVLHNAAPDHVFFGGPEPKPVGERPIKTGFVGVLKEGKRARWLRALKEAGIHIWTRDRTLTLAEYGRKLMDCSISLNLSEFNELNVRPFESLAAGCILVNDWNQDIAALQKESPNLFLRTFDYTNEDPKDCIKVLRELLGELESNPQELSRRAQMSREEVRKNHLYSSRARQILRSTGVV